ncbi:MAG: adenylate/guanylate cyclase domain-containing protein [Bdellovibrionaceae bacterium]|nr:adenylate/guanylate cyclase domain-containing protein [Pseudobdellovibrionaceae bacterium]
MTKILLWLKKVVLSPSALGLLLTFIIISLAFVYYTSKDQISKNSEHGIVLKTLKIIDEKSIDMRLISRGPRPGDDNVALLTVDEKAVGAVGRWPWPRDVTAKAIDNAVKLGAKVIAFDMVFSEPSDNPIQKIFENYKQSLPMSSDADAFFKKQLEKYDADEALANTFSKHSNHIVAGSFYEHSFEHNNFSRHEDICQNWIFEQSQPFQIWDNEEVIISYEDEREIFIPDLIKEQYKAVLSQIESEVLEETTGALTPLEKAELQTKILNEKYDFCSRWLNPESDPTYEGFQAAWGQLKAKDENGEIENENFDEFVNNIINNSLSNIIPQAAGWVMNTPQISRGAKHTGFFNAQQDMDGTLRRSRLLVRNGKHFMPSIAFKAFLLGKNYNANVQLVPNLQNPGTKKIGNILITNNETGEEVKDYKLPVDGEGLLQVNYAGPQKIFPYVSMADMLSTDEEMEIEQASFNKITGKLEGVQKKKVNKKQFINGKYFILGATAIGIFDLRVTPFDENYPGAETHVNVLDNLLRNDFLSPHPDEETTMLVVLLVMGILLSIALSKLGAVYGLLLTLLAFTGIALFDKYYLFEQGILVSIIFPLALTSSLYVLLTFYKYFTEERNKRELRSTFQKYVSPAIVDEVLKNPKNIELGGRKENITVLFSDIRGFTTISEKLDPRALSDLLNSYLTPMTDLVFENRGTLDKYMGDAVMAFFGAPIHYEQHPQFACRCALQMLEKLNELQTEYRKQGLPEIDIGIGLNSGDCSVGNMGSQTVRSYTVMGDAVNLGSRLEGINKQYGTRIIISEFTHAKVKDTFTCREVDLVRVKGKILPVHIYELVSEGPASTQIMTKLGFFNKGYQLYHQKEFSAAMEQFNQALNVQPEDYCSKLYIDRCQNYIAEPPPQDWDGVFIMTTK